MSPGYDTAGPMARTALDCAVAFAALADRSTPVTVATSLTGLRVGLPEPYFVHLHPDTRAAVEDAAHRLESLGATVEWTPRPGLDPAFDGFHHVWADVAHHHRPIWDDPAVSDEVASLIDLGRRSTGLDYAASRAAADRIRDEFADALRPFDVLLTPATPYPAPRTDEEEVAVTGGTVDVRRGGPSRLTVPINEAGVPAVAFPVGATADGLPLGAQLIGPPYGDERLLAIVAAHQQL
jgi:aspartyl-tRNA(Asn)/glutamyl-tRNA(Gln) amidotransferase subunit A